MGLEMESATYHRELPRLLTEGGEGKYVLIREHEVAGVYTSYMDAMSAGYEKFGLEPFFVKKIEAVEEIKVITRHIRPCRT